MKRDNKPERTPVPFDDALRQILKSPPQHKEAPKKKTPTQPKKGKGKKK